MIPLTLKVTAEPSNPYVVRLCEHQTGDHRDELDAVLVQEIENGGVYASINGLIELSGAPAQSLKGDVVLVDPATSRVERLLRAGSDHNTLLVTERCDQLCVMCSQPPKKTHVDRFANFRTACLLAERSAIIGITGGEPTLYKAELLEMIEDVLAARPDLHFHVLTNGQHFERSDIERLRNPVFQRVLWGIPLYSHAPSQHDDIVGKIGAFDRLQESLAHLIYAGAKVELRTVLLSTNVRDLLALSKYVASRLRFVDAWSIMQLENIGYARNRWAALYFDHSRDFQPIAAALDNALLHGVCARLFNFPRCTVPSEYRDLAAASISDWKRRYASACDQCREKSLCSGFFEWHPDPDAAGVTPL